jgi:hypothetical protein
MRSSHDTILAVDLFVLYFIKNLEGKAKDTALAFLASHPNVSTMRPDDSAA